MAGLPPGGDGILDTSSWHFGVLDGVHKDCSMEQLRGGIEHWNNYNGQKVELAVEPRTLVPCERENPESLHRSVVIAFKTKDELKYFMKQKIKANLWSTQFLDSDERPAPRSSQVSRLL
jgi:hypothetical protein